MKFLLLFALLSAGLHSYAQEHATPYTHCQLTLDEVLEQQSFDIDEPISENARYIVFSMYAHLNEIYAAEEQGNTTELEAAILAFEEALEDAANMQLNFSMFQQDITHVESITL